MNSIRLVLLSSALLIDITNAHGFVTKPASRNYHTPFGDMQSLGGTEGPDHTGCTNFAGRGEVTGTQIRSFATTGFKTSYPVGSVIDIEVKITAYHGGKFEFRIQDVGNNNDPDGTKWESITPLEVVSFTPSVLDEDNRYKCDTCDVTEPCAPGLNNVRMLRGFQNAVPGTCAQIPLTGGNGLHTIKVKLPSNMACEHCVMQWHWTSANSCDPKLACPQSEQFWNCMDIELTGDAIPTPEPPTLPTPTPPLNPPTPAAIIIVTPTSCPSTGITGYGPANGGVCVDGVQARCVNGVAQKGRSDMTCDDGITPLIPTPAPTNHIPTAAPTAPAPAPTNPTTPVPTNPSSQPASCPSTGITGYGPANGGVCVDGVQARCVNGVAQKGRADMTCDDADGSGGGGESGGGDSGDDGDDGFGATPAPTPSPPTLSNPTPLPTSQPTRFPTPPPPLPVGLAAQLESALDQSAAAFAADVLLYETPELQRVPSIVYKFPDMRVAVRQMYENGVGSRKLWIGDGDGTNHVYGLVNLAAFLAQSMKETIKYDACDENSWDLVAGKYPASNACGQLGQSYQDYKCSASEAHMQCEVDTTLEITATTNAKWYGAPGPMKCGPKSKLPNPGYWDHSAECNKPWANPPEHCTEYEGQKAGKWVAGVSAANSAGRTDIEGCCYWGRGVIQTTGVCNFGKLNYYLGKRAAEEGRPSAYPDIDFCKQPDAICASSQHPELKWIAGLFYWVESVQAYDVGGWNYIAELKRYVDGGMRDEAFINAVSGIVNRGCHNPPCATGALDGGPERVANFHTVLGAMGLKN